MNNLLLHSLPLILAQGFRESILFRNSFISSVAESDPLGKFILFILLCFSIGSWTVMIAKWFSLRKITRECQKFLDVCKKTARPSQGYAAAKRYKGNPISRLYQAFYSELQAWERSFTAGETVVQDQTLHQDPVRVRIMERVLEKAILEESNRLEKDLSFLATTSSVCPFIGLFGTVWGILVAFRSMASQGSADISTVAPGISVALTTTVAGLAVAIPALVGYNSLLSKVNSLITQMDVFGADLVSYVEKHFS